MRRRDMQASMLVIFLARHGNDAADQSFLFAFPAPPRFLQLHAPASANSSGEQRQGKQGAPSPARPGTHVPVRRTRQDAKEQIVNKPAREREPDMHAEPHQQEHQPRHDGVNAIQHGRNKQEGELNRLGDTADDGSDRARA